ncbi:hypothetical protein [Veillonella caviae]|nr:hypothetical protein [Veillonella caviae]MDD7290361.1 hypothetical protein [Veillonella caviae]MDY6224667.1 hypothetical protein [Veillonella caviae]
MRKLNRIKLESRKECMKAMAFVFLSAYVLCQMYYYLATGQIL